MRKTFTSIKILFAAVAVALSLGIATPANAATCQSGFICFWTSANYTGSKKTLSVGTCYNFSAPFDESITSVWNNSGSNNHYYIYNAPNCAWTDNVLRVEVWDAIPDLASPWDNRISSVGPA